jgi:predicted transcriptional regulator
MILAYTSREGILMSKRKKSLDEKTTHELELIELRQPIDVTSFREYANLPPGSAASVRLRVLTASGFLQETYDRTRSRYVYELTDKGKEILNETGD